MQLIFINFQTFLVWVNEEDHLRIISMQNGGDVGQVLARLIKGVKGIESQVPFSRDERLGYLTFCPSNLVDFLCIIKKNLIIDFRGQLSVPVSTSDCPNSVPNLSSKSEFSFLLIFFN